MQHKYIVFYVKNSEPKVKGFKNLKLAENFADKFKKSLENGLENGYWIDYIVEGQFVKIYDSIPIPKKLIRNKK